MDVTVFPKRLDGVLDAVSNKSFSFRILSAVFLSGEKTVVNVKTVGEDLAETVSFIKNFGFSVISDKGKLTFVPNGINAEREIELNGKSLTLKYFLPILFAMGKEVDFVSEEKTVSFNAEDVCELKGVGFSGERTPFSIFGKLKSGEYDIEKLSDSQFIGSLIMALPVIDGDSKIICQEKFLKKTYVKITLEVMKLFGIKFKTEKDGIIIFGNQKYVSPGEVSVEGDWLASSFILASNAIGNRVRITGLNPQSVQQYKNVKDYLVAFNSKGTVLDVKSCPNFLYMLSVCAVFACSDTVIKNLPKDLETVSVFVQAMKSIGAQISLEEGEIRICGKGRLNGGGIVDTHGDGKIGIALSLAGCFAENPITILSAEAVNKVYPFFFNDFKFLGGEVKVV